MVINPQVGTNADTSTNANMNANSSGTNANSSGTNANSSGTNENMNANMNANANANSSGEPVIHFKGTSKTYTNGSRVLNNINLAIHEGEFVTLLGSSGGGKTTLLKMINGLVEPTDGSVYILGKKLKDWNIIELRRSIGYVVQQVSLFPHMSVEKNIAYTMSIQGQPLAKSLKRVWELAEVLRLDMSLLKRYPHELSGGQQQRVAVARALASDQSILLMDEPFSAVDEIVRHSLRQEIKEVQQDLGKTVVFVTHDIEEAFFLGSKIVLLNNGRIEFSGSALQALLPNQSEFTQKFFKSKGFAAYLNVTTIGDILEPEQNLEAEVAKGSTNTATNTATITIDAQETLMEGLQMMLKTGTDTLAVRKNNKVVGSISMGNIYRKVSE